jgi:hypothetical protein
VANNVINSKRIILKSASNTFFYASLVYLRWQQILTRPAWAGFKTAEEGRAKICKFLWQKLKNKSNIKKHIMNNFRTFLEQF